MSPVQRAGFVCTLVAIGVLPGLLRAEECPATPVCWWRCRPTVSCYAFSPCGAPVCCEPTPCKCGPIRRLLGLCCHPFCSPTGSCCAPPPPPAPCSACGPTIVPAGPPRGIPPSPTPPVFPSPAAAPTSLEGSNAGRPRSPYAPYSNSTYPQQEFVPLVGENNYQQPVIAPVPPQPLTPPRPSAPVRLDHFASFTRSQE